MIDFFYQKFILNKFDKIVFVNKFIILMTGKVYVASMNLRGKWAIPIDTDTIKVNVTSANLNKVNIVLILV